MFNGSVEVRLPSSNFTSREGISGPEGICVFGISFRGELVEENVSDFSGCSVASLMATFLRPAGVVTISGGTNNSEPPPGNRISTKAIPQSTPLDSAA